MDSSRQAVLFAFFGELSGTAPKSVNEYNRTAGKALGDIADTFGIGKVVYTITPPDNSPLDLDIPERVQLYEGSEETGSEPRLFRWMFTESGNMTFEVYPVKGSDTVMQCEKELTQVFGLLYHLFNAILFDEFYNKLSRCDPFTGIPNLSAFLSFCGKMSARGKIGEYTALSFNIRNFKSIHNSLTYLEGNKVMMIYCDIVSKAVTERELVAHIGGDNFVAMILNENKDYFLDLICNMVIKYRKDDTLHTFSFGATVGALKLNGGEDPGDIMMHTSTAYQAARENRTIICYYDKNAELGLLEQKTILSKFFQAVLAREFRVMYQPKVSVKDKSLCGAEALVRWVRPDGGVVMPGSFIPVLEKDGCICTLDFYVLEEVCKFQKRLLKEGTEPVKVSVNFSKRHLSNNKLVEEIVEMIDRYNVPHKYIEVELTESEDFHNNGMMKDIVDDLCARGIKTSIDDFGTGYSSLGMLRTLQLDTLKIDRSFIPDLNNKDREKSLLMLKGVINLAKSLGLTTVAEGVETPDQLEMIEDLECDIVQGYIFDKPLPEEEFLKRLKQRVYVLDKDPDNAGQLKG